MKIIVIILMIITSIVVVSCTGYNNKMKENKTKIAKNTAAIVAMSVSAYISKEPSELKRISKLSCEYGEEIKIGSKYNVQMPEGYKCKIDGNSVVVTEITGISASVVWDQ